MSFLSTIFTVFIIIPIVPLFAYVIGLLVPASHIVSRSSTFKITPSRLWNILTDVSKYPQWQPKVERVIIDDDTSSDETVFVEYSTKKRHTVIIHHERIENKCLLRILEERPVATAPAPSKIPTFSGSWTFDISQEKEDDDQVTLKITEQGVIKKPLVRVTHLLLFGFHSRIHRFLNDLHKKIDIDNQEVPLMDPHEQVDKLDVTTYNSTLEEQLPLLPTKEKKLPVADTNEEKEQNLEESVQQQDDNKQQLYYSTLQNSRSAANNEHNQKESDNTLSAAVTTDDRQQVKTNDILMTESRIADKEWDLVSEIYERSSKPDTTTNPTTTNTINNNA